MSFRLYSLAWAILLPATEKLVLLKLIDHAADDGSNVRPSVAAIATACGLSKRAVQMALRQLQKLGFVVLVKEADFGTKRPREYRIDVKEMASSATANQGTTNTGEQDAPLNDVHRCIERHEPVHRSTRTGEPRAPKSIIEPINESIKPVLSEPALALKSSVNLKKKIIAYPPDFEEFWKAYPTNRNMPKPNALKAWLALSEDDHQAAMASLPAFRQFCAKDPTYKPVYAERYLSQRRFDGHLEGTEKISNASPAIFVKHDTPAWEAWRAHYLRTKGRTPPISNGPTGSGWYFSSEFPPVGADQCA